MLVARRQHAQCVEVRIAHRVRDRLSPSGCATSSAPPAPGFASASASRPCSASDNVPDHLAPLVHRRRLQRHQRRLVRCPTTWPSAWSERLRCSYGLRPGGWFPFFCRKNHCWRLRPTQHPSTSAEPASSALAAASVIPPSSQSSRSLTPVAFTFYRIQSTSRSASQYRRKMNLNSSCSFSPFQTPDDGTIHRAYRLMARPLRVPQEAPSFVLFAVPDAAPLRQPASPPVQRQNAPAQFALPAGLRSAP